MRRGTALMIAFTAALVGALSGSADAQGQSSRPEQYPNTAKACTR